jgi:hypothetical protein
MNIRTLFIATLALLSFNLRAESVRPESVRQEYALAESGDARPAENITWDDLLPPDWVPPATSVDHFFDETPAQTLSSAESPVVSAMNRRRVRLPGYLVPIDLEGERVRSFLMVPYFGACIHVPPPPPNQVVFVELEDAVSLADPYGAHWVTGELRTSNSSTDLAEAAYSMRGESVEVFDWEARHQQGDP